MKIFKPLKLLTHLFFIAICWVKQNLLLFFTILIIEGMTVLGAVNSFEWKEGIKLKEERWLEYYHILLSIGAIITLLWTYKRYQQAEKRYWQVQDSIFLNKIDNLYIEVVKLISEQNNKGLNKYMQTPNRDVRLTNLINAIQASITSHYKNREEPKNIRATILNFAHMDLSYTSLKKVNLQGANLQGADLRSANLEKANLNKAKYDYNTKGISQTNQYNMTNIMNYI